MAANQENKENIGVVAAAPNDMRERRVSSQQAHQRPAQQRRPTSGISVLSGGTGGGGQKQHKLKQRFTVIKKLGKGTYGKVQLAINKETGQEVAIKTIKKTKIENEQDLQRVRREIQIMSSIEHPHIIHIYEVFENKDKIVLIMQYAPGGELYEYVSRSKVLDDSEARRLFRQIATAIYYCHQNKICHRDLKLENILLDEKNNAKLADFGLSNIFDKKRQLKTFCGSPLYASPEIVQGSPYEGPEVDCWSLGVLLYTLVYGAMPFDGSNFKRLVKQISEACYYEPKQKSLASPLIGRLLCADPAKRANILDICSDPWVNGAMASCSPRLSPSGHSQPQPGHTSLLKVAQDMANLTPVRFDILLALTPTSLQPVIEQPSNDLHNSVPSNQAENIRQEPERAPRRIPVDSTLMELDKNRASSPVASYVVRDLDGSSEMKIDHTSANNDELVSQTDKEPEKESEIIHHEEFDSKQDVQSKGDDSCQQDICAETTTVDQTDDTDAMQVGRQLAEPESIQDDLQKLDAVERSPPMNAVVETTMEDIKPLSGAEKPVQSEEVAMDIDEKQPTEDIHAAPVVSSTLLPEEQASAKTSEEQVESSAKQVHDGDKTIPTPDERPKKVKKKIVVIKKKKRVSKKDPDAVSETPAEDNSNDKSKVDKVKQGEDPSSKGPQVKGPGKVRIPDTFQANESEQQQPTRKPSLTGRRQSALIADVSQKLLQQQLNGTSNSAILVDQPQLASVRVSDKKSEFERRTSLTTALTALVSPRSQMAINEEGDIEGNRQQDGDEDRDINRVHEPTLAEHQLDLMSIVDSIGHTIVEPVNRQQPLISVALRPPELSSSEPLTLTGNEPSPEVDKKVAECADHLSTGDKSPSSLDATIHDDRSDSVDTIKAELSLESPTERQESPKQASVRSSFQINLSGTPAKPMTQQQQSMSIGQQQAPRQHESSSLVIGPAPIARSYKKVTFTKDGTCITETGKIYSTQGDDGTVRRIERKSKVTHYPSDSGNEKASEEATHEEVIYESGSRVWQGSQSSIQSSSQAAQRNRPFDRLIMPCRDFFHPMDDFEDQGNDLMSRYESPFESEQPYQQRGCTDSASSCSSGSTDVFDDTFDTWTGTISMFNQGMHLPDLRNSLMSRAFGGSPLPFSQSIFSTSRRAGRHPRPQSGHFGGGESSAAAPGRCESVEPPNSLGHRHRHHRRTGNQTTSEQGSGYDSDAPVERPASATLGSARGRTFGSTNLFPHPTPMRDSHFNSFFEPHKDDLFEPFGDRLDPFGDSLIRDIEMEHKMLRRKIAHQQKQLWRGSTPSLHDPGVVLSQSSSNNAQVRQQVPNSASLADPIRRNTANLADHLPPRQPTQRSASKASFVTNQMANMQINSKCGSTHSSLASLSGKHHRVASFIELKRSPSSSLQQQQHPQNQHNRPEIFANNSSRVMSNSSSSSAFWDERMTPTTSSMDSHEQPSLQENCDSRIQNWLQQSAGNLSISSGSKSSASDTIASGNRNDPNQLLGHLSREEPVLMQTLANKQHQLPPAPSRSPNRQPIVHGSQVGQHTSTLARTVRSSSRQSINNEQKFIEIHEQQSIIRHDKANQLQQLNKTSSATKVSRATFAFVQNAPKMEEEWPIKSRQQVVSEQTRHHKSESHVSLSQAQRVPSPSTAPISGRNADYDLQWIQSSALEPSNSHLFGDDFLDDSLSGSAADLESRSSSSLLDQLRTRGYRSMINQRLVSNQPAAISEIHQEEQSSRIVTSTSSATSLSDSTAAARFVSSIAMTMSSSEAATNSASTTRIVHSTSSTKQKTSNNQREPDDQSNAQSQHVHSDGIDKSCEVDENDNQKTMPNVENFIGGEQKQQNIINGDVGVGENDPNQNANNQSNSNLNRTDTYLNNHCDDVHANDEQEQDDMDEDVREAKANIKEYLDRMRETEKFLKSMHEEEENLERQRQQLFLFNNLLLRTKLNGIRSATQSIQIGQGQDSSDGVTCPFGQKTMQIGTPRSATVWTGGSDFGIHEHINGFMPSSIGSNSPDDYALTQQQYSTSFNASSYNSPVMHRFHKDTVPVSCFSSDLYKPVNSNQQTISRDPFEPVQPLYLHTDTKIANRYTPTPNSGSWRRSKSQLGDQYSNSFGNAFTSTRRPLSATLDQISSETNPFFQSRHKRSISQLRYAPTKSNRYSQPVMSEYRSAYGPNLISSSHSPARRATSPLPIGTSKSGKSSNDDEASSSDDGMSAYRPQSYVPRVVPEGGPSHRGRDSLRRSAFKAKNPTDSSSLSSHSFHERRTSLQLSNARSYRYTKERSVSPVVRRSSLAGSSSTNLTNQTTIPQMSENSRLTELEQRIQANKRRREELLSGKLTTSSPVRESTQETVQHLDQQTTRAGKQQKNNSGDEDDDSDCLNRPTSLNVKRDTPLTSVSVSTQSGRARPSRLESMEARIKRRSYYVRMNSPERAKASRWSQTKLGQRQSFEATSTSSSARRLSYESPVNGEKPEEG